MTTQTSPCSVTSVGFQANYRDDRLNHLVGEVFGLILYLVNFYGMTALFPWFAMARNWVSIFAHVMFGMVAALSCVWLRRAKI